jgi:hypothetical protein
MAGRFLRQPSREDRTRRTATHDDVVVLHGARVLRWTFAQSIARRPDLALHDPRHPQKESVCHPIGPTPAPDEASGQMRHYPVAVGRQPLGERERGLDAPRGRGDNRDRELGGDVREHVLLAAVERPSPWTSMVVGFPLWATRGRLR